jgi:hypothetical protein
MAVDISFKTMYSYIFRSCLCQLGKLLVSNSNADIHERRSTIRYQISITYYYRIDLIFDCCQLIDIRFKNGFYSSIPYICCLTFAGTSSLVADKLIVAKTLPRSTVRKIFNSTGSFCGVNIIRV